MISAGEGRYTVRLESYSVGKDMLIAITGGEEDHIGSATLIETKGHLQTIIKKGHQDHVVSEKMANIIQVRAIESITQLQASLNEHGADYVGGSTSNVVKFELWLDASQLSQFDANATEIYDFSFNIGWNASDLQALAWGVTGDQLAVDNSFVSYNYSNANDMAITFNPDNNGVASIAFSSPNSVVDTLTPLFGADTKGPELLIATFYTLTLTNIISCS